MSSLQYTSSGYTPWPRPIASAYSGSMKNKNKPANQERNLITTNTGCAVILCLALAFAAATGHAVEPNGPSGTATETNLAPPMVTHIPQHQAADIVINNEIFKLLMTDPSIHHSLNLSVHNGVVTVGKSLADAIEQQRVVNALWLLRGVKQVKDDRGITLPSTHSKRPVVGH